MKVRLLPVLTLAFALYSKPPYKTMCDFNEAFAAGTSRSLHLSPICGQYAIESSLIKNWYCFGDYNCPMVKLLHNLFFCTNIHEFDATIYKPYARFTPEIIAIFVAALEQKRVVSDQTRKQLETHHLPMNKRVTEFLCGLEKAQSTEKILYPEHTVQRILLAFLYQKSTTKEELIRYVQELQKCLPDNLIGYIPKENWHKSDLQIFDLWRARYSWHYESAVIDTKQASYIGAGFLSARYRDLQYPPELTWMRNVPYKKLKKIPDCFETLLRNVCNHLLYDATCFQFDQTRLPQQSPARIFYALHKKASHTKINSLAAHKDWLLLTAGIANAEYKQKEDYELLPTIENFLISMQYLLYGTAYVAEDNLSEQEKIGKVLALPGVHPKVHCSEQTDGTTVCQINLNYDYGFADRIVAPQTITIFLQSLNEHAWFMQNGLKNPYESLKALNKKRMIPTAEWALVCDIIRSDSFSKRDLALLYAPLYEPDQLELNLFNRMLLYAYPTVKQEQRYQLFKRLLRGTKRLMRANFLRSSLFFLKSLLNILETFSSSYQKQQALRALIDSKLYSVSLVKQTMLYLWDSLDDWDKQRIIVALAANEAFDYGCYRALCKKFLQQNVPNSNSALIHNEIELLLTLFRYRADRHASIHKAISTKIGLLSGKKFKKLLLKYKIANKLGIIP